MKKTNKLKLRLLEMITKQVVNPHRRVLKCMKTFYIIPSCRHYAYEFESVQLAANHADKLKN